MVPSDNDQFECIKAELLTALPRLHRFAHNLTGNPADAEDLLQSTSERVLSRWHQFQAGTEFDRWAFTIMRSIRYNHSRSEAVRFGQGHEDAAVELVAPENQSPERNKIRQEVFNTIGRLNEGQRDVMILVYVEGFSYEAAANILDIPVGTVMSRIGRARVKMAAELSTANERTTVTPGTLNSQAAARTVRERTKNRQSSSDSATLGVSQAGNQLDSMVKQ